MRRALVIAVMAVCVIAYAAAIEFADFPVMAAYLAFVGFSFVLINLIVDLTYLLVDPRLRVK